MDALIQLDTTVFWWIHNLSGSGLDYPIAVLAYITRTTLLLIVSAVLMLIFVKQDKIKKLLIFLIPIYFIDIFIGILKSIIGRLRPFETIGDAVQVVDFFGMPSSLSFPSGHATITFASAALLVGLFGKRFYFLYFGAALVALSRVYMGVHYPSDVIAGTLLGYGLGKGCVALAKKHFLKTPEQVY